MPDAEIAKVPNETERKSLVVDDKWLGALDAAIHGEMDRISQALVATLSQELSMEHQS